MPTIKNENIGRIVLAIDPIEALHKDVADAFEYARKHKVILNQSDIASQRAFCKKVYKILSTRMVQGLYTVEKTKKKIKEGMTSDNVTILMGTSTYAYSILCDIDSRFAHVIPLSDFPSCKHMLSLQKDLIKTAIKELCEDNPIVKQLIHIGAIAKGIYDANTIIQVLMFYKNFVLELEREQNDEHWTLCEMEQWLLDKSNAECGYCYLALLKVGCTLSKEIHDFIDEAKAHASIHHFENTSHNQTDQYSAQPVLNNLRDNQEPK
jgi:hypothetical protein